MKIFSVLFILFLSSSVVYANGGGGHGGVRPGMGVFSFGGNSGSGGTRPGMELFQTSTPVDLVKSIGFDRTGSIQFQYKGFEKPQVEVHAINIQEVSEKYLDALKRSQKSQQWEPVDIEGLEN